MSYPIDHMGEKRKGGSIHRSDHHTGTSTKPSNSGMKQSTPMLLITDGRLGYSDLPIDDDNFVDAPPSWKGTSIHEDSPSGEHKSDDTTDSEDMPSKDVVDELRNYVKGQISDLQSENRLLSKQLQAMQSQVSSLKSDQQKKLKLLVSMQVEFSCSIEPPSFDLGLGFTQPSQLVAKTSKEIEVQVNSVISNILKDTKCIEQEYSPQAAPSSGLPVKRAPKPAKALQSPYVVDEAKQMKSSRNVVIFEHYNQNVEDADVPDFQNWKKFNDKDDDIRPPFSIGQYLVGNKTWWYELVCREVSLTSSVSYYTKVIILKGMLQYRSH
ncbi:Hypothetical predicted protein [Olea europaea subsp. europaea]|uniref:Uncharacterized protein n=1 Tax=Olea europaea subsp. europaea TaxID=158383 RepID=A0A8S0TB86_OLEEU|nr:Hypothetical predicted protein [Olea europaea subsp. europaea]